MNIFLLDSNPTKIAQYHCDSHAVKMILEYAQMLSTAHRMLDGEHYIRLGKNGRKIHSYSHPTLENVLYLDVHHNHPCTRWVRENHCNYEFMYDVWDKLCGEFQYRFHKVHSTYTKLQNILCHQPKNISLSTECSNFPIAMGSNPECIDYSDPIQSYRDFYHKKPFKMLWKYRDDPPWFSRKLHNQTLNELQIKI